MTSVSRNGNGCVIRDLDLSNRREVLEVLDLQQASYAVEARLIGSSDIPPLGDTVDTLERCGETFCGYFLEKLTGAVSYRERDDVLEVHRLVVHPDYFRRGIARSLMGHVERIARRANKRIVVSTGTKNVPARRLYQSLGFEETGRPKRRRDCE